MHKNPIITICLALLLAGASQVATAQVAVIVNPKNPIAAMTPEQVSAIFLGKTSTLPSGQSAAPADLPEGSSPRDLFYSKAAGKSSSQVKATWARLTFSGKATPPKEVATAVDVKRYVASNPDAIGYIEKSAVDPSVKVVLMID